MKQTWWKESIIYQIYPRSFKDSNADGIGDLRGIISKLDYLKNLGIDILWLCPIYSSPNDDNGYDISNYRDIMEEFGTMADFDELLAAAHHRGLKIIMDLVVNHSSDEHPWFVQARQSKDNPYRDYYIWKKGIAGKPPNNWPSFFGGNAWAYDAQTGEYYLHLFTKKQPDLNWENAQLRQEVYKLMRFWLDKGIDGFRMDVIALLSKRQDFADTQLTNFGQIIAKVYANGPRVHEFLKEMHAEVLSKYDIMTVGEAVGVDKEQAKSYVGEDRHELHMIFQFDHLFIDHGKGGKFDIIPFTLQQFKDIFADWDKAMDGIGWNSIFLDNHDFPRMVSRFGNDTTFRLPSAKLLFTLLLTFRGTPYVYQGDEIGMTNVAFDTIDDYRDIETLNFYQEAQKQGADTKTLLKKIHQQGRDNARTPMQWNSGPNAGFSTATRPWIKLNPNYASINLELAEKHPDSILNYFKDLTAFRKQHKLFIYGTFEQLAHKQEDIFAYLRTLASQEAVVILNFSDTSTLFECTNLPKNLTQVKGNYGEHIGRSLATSLPMLPWEASIFVN